MGTLLLVPGLTGDAGTIAEMARFAANLGNVERVTSCLVRFTKTELPQSK